MKLRILAMLALLSLSACDSGHDTSATSELKNKIDNLTQKISDLESKISSLEIYNFYQDSQIAGLNNTGATFSPSSQGYASISTPAGKLLVIMSSMEKYASGYKIVFRIGNPNFIRYNDVSLKIKWNSAFDDKKDKWSEWNSKWKETTKNIEYPLQPSSWNTVVAVISPAKEEETETINIDVAASKVEMIYGVR